MAFHPTSFPSLFYPPKASQAKGEGGLFTVSFKIVLILKKPRTNRPRYSPFSCDAPTLFFCPWNPAEDAEATRYVTSPPCGWARPLSVRLSQAFICGYVIKKPRGQNHKGYS